MSSVGPGRVPLSGADATPVPHGYGALMGEEVATVADAATAISADASSEAASEASGSNGRLRGRSLVLVILGALVAVVGIVVAITFALQNAAHAEAFARAEAAHASAASAVDEHQAALDRWERTAADAVALRDAVGDGVLPHGALLGGDAALAPVTAAQTTLADALERISSPVEPPTRVLEVVGPELGTDELAGLADRLEALATQVRASRLLLAGQTADIAAEATALERQVRALAESLPATHEALLAARTLAPEDVRAAATAAMQAISAVDVADAPGLMAAYASAVGSVISAHDTEAARLAAEEAARQAAQQPKRSGSSGSGGGGTTSNGVLTATNAHRAADGKGALAWNSTLASRSCSWASHLAASDSGLSHSSDSSGFGWWGENVASGYRTASAVVTGWMNSTGHRENILNGNFTKMGSCSATAASGTLYWVQQFGS